MVVNTWKSYVCTAFEEMNIESILAVMNTTELVVEIKAASIPCGERARFRDDTKWRLLRLLPFL